MPRPDMAARFAKRDCLLPSIFTLQSPATVGRTPRRASGGPITGTPATAADYFAAPSCLATQRFHSRRDDDYASFSCHFAAMSRRAESRLRHYLSASGRTGDGE